MAIKPKLLMVTAVWGDWHIDVFQNINLPTMMSPKNLPALAEICDIHYVIYTSVSDRSRIGAMTNLTLRLAALTSLEIRVLDDETLKNPIAAHHLAWTLAIEEARQNEQLILLMPPDVAWANNSFHTVGKLLAQGYTAIFMTYLRAEEESFMAALRAEPLASDSSRVITPERMVELCIDSLHPLMATYLADSEFFPIHPEMIVWPVSGEGLLLRILAREMFLFDPRTVELNKQQLPNTPIRPGEGYFISDSDELFAVSLAPLGKDADWHRYPHKANPVDIGAWWNAYDSASNDFVVSHRLRWHYAPVTEAKWRAVERRSDLLIRRTAAAREGIRFWGIARRLGRPTAARLLAVAVQTGVMPRALVGRGPAAALLPEEDSLAALGADRIEALLAPSGARALAALLRRQVVPVHGGLIYDDDPLARAADVGMHEIICSEGPMALAHEGNGKLRLGKVTVRIGPLRAGIHWAYQCDRLVIEVAEIDKLLCSSRA